MYMLGFVGIGTAVLTAIVMCILIASDKKNEDGKTHGLDTSGLFVVVGTISAILMVYVSGGLVRTSKPHTIKESIITTTS